MANILTALARLFQRRDANDFAPSGSAAHIKIHERDRVLSGQDLYREIKAANEAEDAADFKAFSDRIDKNMPG